MSGGSYEYLYSKVLVDTAITGLIGRMATDMKGEKYYTIAAYLDAVLTKFDEAVDLFNRLEKVMHDYEWYCSGDISRQDFELTMGSFLTENSGEPISAAGIREAAELNEGLDKLLAILKQRVAKLIY